MRTDVEKKNDLKDGISVLYEMETNNYMMTRMIKTIDNTIKKLGNPRRIAEPVRTPISGNLSATGGAAVLGGVLGASIGCLAGCSNASGFFSAIDAFVGGLFGGGILGVILGVVIGVIIDRAKMSEQEEEADRKYKMAYAEYQKQVKAEQTRLKREEQIEAVWIAERNALVKKRNESQALLADLYETIGIDSRFRTFISIVYMYDYIRLGISNKLEGIDGLYYLIQQRLQWDYINLKLEDIVNKLDTIINNQDSIYHELIALNSKCDGMMNMMSQAISIGIHNGQQLDEIRENTGAASYNTERLRREYEIRNWIMH